MPSRTSDRFIVASTPVLATAPPTGTKWIHEVKHDGWRAQLHLWEGVATIYSRAGADFTKRFGTIAAALKRLQVQSVIIDAELVASDPEGNPSFDEMLRGAPHGCCAWCFDLLELDGTSQLMAPLEYRRHLLKKLLKRTKSDTLRLSGNFRDPLALLRAAEVHGLEGIVSKLREDRYRSGKNPGWLKVKTDKWRDANRDRFEKMGRGKA